MTEYARHLLRQGLKRGSITTAKKYIYALVGPVWGAPVAGITPAKASELYLRYAEDHAADTHRNALGACRRWARWCLEQNWVRANVWDSVKPVGRRRKGKPQLRIDEARRLWAHLEPLLETDQGALAVSLALLLGLRRSEIVSLEARDVDAGGTLLWIARSKSDAGVRELPVPEALQPHLVRLAARGGRLFPFQPLWVYAHTKRLCAAAGVPEVSPHGLRGLHATLAVSASVISRALGHASEGVTRAHYIAPGAIEAATAQRVQNLLAFFPSSSPPHGRSSN